MLIKGCLKCSIWALCVCIRALRTSENLISHCPEGHVKLTTSWTVAEPLDLSRSVSFPFTILPSLDFGALVLIPIMSNHTRRTTIINQHQMLIWLEVACVTLIFFLLANYEYILWLFPKKLMCSFQDITVNTVFRKWKTTITMLKDIHSLFGSGIPSSENLKNWSPLCWSQSCLCDIFSRFLSNVLPVSLLAVELMNVFMLKTFTPNHLLRLASLDNLYTVQCSNWKASLSASVNSNGFVFLFVSALLCISLTLSGAILSPVIF